MNIRCPGCGATAEYSAKELKMICKHCGKVFSAYEAAGISSHEKSETHKEIHKNEEGKRMSNDELRRHATIKMRHFRCSACGAELMAKETEATSYCYYCGQPSVMEEQLSDYLQPDYIIPFQVTQEEAASLLQKSIRRGFFVPSCFKHFKVERLTPIYVPYWLIDVDYQDAQLWEYRDSKGDDGIRYAKTAGRLKLDSYAVEGSSKLEDYAGQRIGPFDFSGLLPFAPSYLSGYYADRFDVGTEGVEEFVNANVKEMFDWEMQKLALKYSTERIYSAPSHRLSKFRYALCPVWFLNITMKNKVYTMLVNGQTGKVVFALPPSVWKMVACFLLVIAAMVAVTVPVFIKMLYLAFFNDMISDDISIITAFAVLAVVTIAGGFGMRLLKVGWKHMEEFKRDIIRINGENNLQYVKDRGTDKFQG